MMLSHPPDASRAHTSVNAAHVTHQHHQHSGNEERPQDAPLDRGVPYCCWRGNGLRLKPHGRDQAINGPDRHTTINGRAVALQGQVAPRELCSIQSGKARNGMYLAWRLTLERLPWWLHWPASTCATWPRISLD